MNNEWDIVKMQKVTFFMARPLFWQTWFDSTLFRRTWFGLTLFWKTWFDSTLFRRTWFELGSVWLHFGKYGSSSVRFDFILKNMVRFDFILKNMVRFRDAPVPVPDWGGYQSDRSSSRTGTQSRLGLPYFKIHKFFLAVQSHSTLLS